MEDTVMTNGILAECCGDESNRVVIEQRGDLTTKRCSVCQRRHFEFIADPGKMFATPA